jgi:hypothetical protein
MIAWLTLYLSFFPFKNFFSIYHSLDNLFLLQQTFKVDTNFSNNKLVQFSKPHHRRRSTLDSSTISPPKVHTHVGSPSLNPQIPLSYFLHFIHFIFFQLVKYNIFEDKYSATFSAKVSIHTQTHTQTSTQYQYYNNIQNNNIIDTHMKHDKIQC